MEGIYYGTTWELRFRLEELGQLCANNLYMCKKKH